MLSNHLNFPSRPDPYAAAHAQATLIGERLSLEKLVANAVERTAARARNPFEWGGASLGKGHTGVALLQLALARHAAATERVADATTATGGVSSEEWLTRAQAQLHSAVGSTHTHPLTSTSVLLGSSGLAMAVADFQQTDDRYATSASRLWQQVAEQVRDHPWPVRESGYAATDYDVVYGAAGVLVALLSSPEALSGQRDAVDILVSYLLKVAGPSDGKDLACRIPPELFPLPEYREQYPFGYYNTGLSHGIPGILSALSAAYRSGYDSPGVRSSLRRLADRLLEWSTPDQLGPDWPSGVPLNEAGTPNPVESVPTRTAWCYGTPGVVVALLQAGAALADADLRSTAITAHRAAMARVQAVPDSVSSPTICHGVAGLLCVAAFVEEQTGDAAARDDVRWLTERLLTHCDSAQPLIVRDEESTGNFVDDPSFLTGAAGVGLSLLSARGGRQSWWNGLMLHG
ncbi:lanthionine synthetase C family protein [Streptomyces sp. NPDC006530]|uniref:lanthionine synthetase C family protein n=1 Tax=Streptomyces sp. NPDC006530 TaxID=3364750 RepID=UPI003682E320